MFNIEKVVVTVETIAKSSIMRRVGVNFLVGAACGVMSRDQKVLTSIALTLAGYLTANAVNDSFDVILEKHDEEVWKEYNRKMKAIDEKNRPMFP